MDNPAFITTKLPSNDLTEDTPSIQEKCDVINDNSTKLTNNNNNNDRKFTVYKIRWGVLATVAFLNISNASIWINNFPTTTKVASYYSRSTQAINWFSLTYMILALPFSFVGTYCVDTYGLKKVIWAGCCLNLTGATIRAIGTSRLISNVNNKYIVSLCGQVFGGVAQNFIIYLHTKVSQTWFADDQRGIATTILSMSNPLGIMITEVTVPFIIKSEEDVPLNDKVWLGVAVFTFLLTVIFVRRSRPKTPPSQSVCASNVDRSSYSKQLRMAFTTVPFLLLLLSLGGGVAFTIVIATVTQQILCPLGYSPAFGGVMNGIMLLFGFIGSIFAGILLDRTKLYTEITKYLFALASLIGIVLFEFLMVPNREVAILIFAALFGLFGVALFPVGLELAVEATFPVDESITVAYIFLSGQLQSIIIIALVPLLSRPKSDRSLSVCGSDYEPRDYTVSLMVVMIFLGLISTLSIAFFKTEYKRQNAEKRMQKVPD